MPPAAADSRYGRIIIVLAAAIAVGMLALGIGSWLTRDRQAGPDPTAAPATRVAPTQPVVAAATVTPVPATATAASTIAPTTAPRPATTAATPVRPTSVASTATSVASSGATATPDLSGPGHVPEPDPSREAQRRVVATIGDGALGDRAAALLNWFYPLVTRAYAESNPELLRPLLDDDAYEGYVRDIRRTNAEPEVAVPVFAFLIQPRVLSNFDPDAYVVDVAEIQYDRDVDPKSRQVIRISKPFRECARWYLREAGGTLRISGGTSIPERFCAAGWPEPPTPTKE